MAQNFHLFGGNKAIFNVVIDFLSNLLRFFNYFSKFSMVFLCLFSIISFFSEQFTSDLILFWRLSRSSFKTNNSTYYFLLLFLIIWTNFIIDRRTHNRKYLKPQPSDNEIALKHSKSFDDDDRKMYLRDALSNDRNWTCRSFLERFHPDSKTERARGQADWAEGERGVVNNSTK